MPRLNGTGPNGEGSKTGLGKGNCNSENNVKQGQFINWVQGLGRGLGFGRGIGRRILGGRNGQGRR